MVDIKWETIREITNIYIYAIRSIMHLTTITILIVLLLSTVWLEILIAYFKWETIREIAATTVSKATNRYNLKEQLSKLIIWLILPIFTFYPN